ncbi:uncharacterized protein LOC129097729 [Anoplopoma fimbria]|uniref:uncharacterized protein LOC129097729 n=1 Tax=Anoplopoma fimbria TaxID=229290 RepID=UPI0023EB7E76|nr:uncharacterized protein LOC129097729 [Anoplopoma fimbria]
MTFRSVAVTGKRKSRNKRKSVSQTPKLQTLFSSSLMFFRLKMFSFVFFCNVWFLLTVLIRCSGNSTAVIRFSVPENHHICLPCAGSDSSMVIWTHRDQKVLVTRQGHCETNGDTQRYSLTSDGHLCLLQLDDSDGGTFSCNQRPVAELQVLTGLDFLVSAGRTLLLPCNGSSKPKKRWSHQREGSTVKTVLTKFRNGTVKPERSRISLEHEALQIQDLQPEDAGEYVCNGKSQGRLTVLTEQPEPTSIQRTTSRTTTAAVMVTDEVDVKKEKKRPEYAMLLVAVVSLALMIFLLTAVCVLLTSKKCRRNKKHRCEAQRHEDTELQPWTTSSTPPEREVHESPALVEETIHYASLGRQNWRERPGRTPADQDQDHVIYSSVVTRPAKKKRPPLLPVGGTKCHI